MCADLTDKDCLSTLDTMVDNMSQDDRFAFEKSFDSYHEDCAGLEDLACLEVLDAARTSASDKNRLVMLKAACTITASIAADSVAARGKDVAGSDSSAPSPLDEQPAPQDSDANPSPDHVDHAGVPKDDTDDEKKEDAAAQEAAHERHPEVGGSDDDDENTSAGCQGKGCSSPSSDTETAPPADVAAPVAPQGSAPEGAAAPAETEGTEATSSVTENQCEICTAMTDKECLAALDAMVTDMDDIDRLAFEKSWAAGICDGKTDSDCLEELDQVRMSATDKKRLTMLSKACASSPAGDEVGSGHTPDQAVGEPDLDVPADQDGSEHEEGSIIEEPKKDEAGAEAEEEEGEAKVEGEGEGVTNEEGDESGVGSVGSESSDGDAKQGGPGLQEVGDHAGDEGEVPAIATIASTEEDNDSREWNMMMSQLAEAQAAKMSAPSRSFVSGTAVGVTASALLVLGVAYAVVNRRLRRPVGDSAYTSIDADVDEIETEALLPQV